MRCGPRNHKTDHCPNMVIEEHPQIQQQQLLDSYGESSNSSSVYTSEEEVEELNFHANACDCSDFENCKCIFSSESEISNESSDEDIQPQKYREKILMAQTEEDQIKILSK